MLLPKIQVERGYVLGSGVANVHAGTAAGIGHRRSNYPASLVAHFSDVRALQRTHISRVFVQSKNASLLRNRNNERISPSLRRQRQELRALHHRRRGQHLKIPYIEFLEKIEAKQLRGSLEFDG